MKWLFTVLLSAIIVTQSLAEEEDGANAVDHHSIEKRSGGCGYYNLRVHISHARRLPDTDGVLDLSDPFVIVVATDYEGSVYRREVTRVRRDTINPLWNEWIEFGTQEWQSLEISVRDKDRGNRNDLLLSTSDTLCNQSGLFQKRHRFGRSRLFYSYILTNVQF